MAAWVGSWTTPGGVIIFVCTKVVNPARIGSKMASGTNWPLASADLSRAMPRKWKLWIGSVWWASRMT